MSSTRCTLVLLAMLSQQVVADEATFKNEDGIVVLNKDNFNAGVNKFDKLLVKFYAPWCGHCQALAPVLVLAAKKMLATDVEGTIAKFDCTDVDNREISDKFGVKGYPTLFYFEKGSHMRWGKAGVKDQHHIIELFESRKTPAWETVQTVDELNALQTGKGQRVIVGLFYPDFDSEEAKAFKSAALVWAHQQAETKKISSDAGLGSTDRYVLSKSMKVIKALKAKPPAVVVVTGDDAKNKDNRELVSTEKDGFTTRTISTFHTLSVLGSPVMMDGTDDKNKMQLLSLLNAKWGLNEHLIAFVEKSQAAEIQELYRSVVGEDALQTLIPLVYVIGESNDAAKMAKSYGAVLNKELATATGGSSGLQPNLPIFGIANYTQVFTRHRLHHDPSQVNGVCFKDGKEVDQTIGHTKEALLDFTKNYFDKKLPVFYVSAARPTVSDARFPTTKELVADDWNKVAMDEELDVFIMLHAGEHGDTPEWMFHELERVASKFNHVESVVIATYDLHANELPHAIARDLQDATANDLPKLVMFSASKERKKSPAIYGQPETQKLEEDKSKSDKKDLPFEDPTQLDAESILNFIKKTVETVEIDDGDDEDEEEEGEEGETEE